MNTLRQWYSPYAHARVWKDSAHLLLDLIVGALLFSYAVTMLSTSFGMAVTLVGLPLLAVTLVSGRWIAAAERARVRALLGTELAAWPPLPPVSSWWQRMVQRFKDDAGWKAMAYSVVMLPWGIVTFTVTVVLWSVAWSMALLPLFGWALPGMDTGAFHPTLAGRIMLSLLGSVLGWLLVVALPRVMHALAAVDVALARALLSPSASAALQQRVSDLQESRDASTESAALELRRIERDLHDGAQQRLVSVAMNLGMAKDRLGEIDDPRARELVSQAHDEAKQAIVELRELVRGIHPAVLTDRGLDPAVSALAARCPVVITVQSDLARRLPATVEAAAYFVVAEALTNIAKHSRATEGTVRLVDRGDTLVVEVHDDGAGGAVATKGSGLHGLADRVKAVDGRMRIASPDGGPTTLIVELPCGS
ncbi:MAG: sensor histidine kinase [Pseudomonas sp.]|uniref:sensor histidine kinase n=1 Tax=Pseudomonas sp. TaxID=306 RepID=UPI0027224F80|nr:sensor histidine kinase [Pseudomonas sp.]MDO8403130.1 sensor histidine kinase [Pseudomonas sp.]